MIDNHNYLFVITRPSSDFCGESFFVYADSFPEARMIANAVVPGEEPRFCGAYSDEEAEAFGCDTY